MGRNTGFVAGDEREVRQYQVGCSERSTLHRSLVLGEVPSKCNQFRLDLCGVQAINLCLSVHLPPCASMPSRSRRKLRWVRWLSLWLAITEFLLALEITSCLYSVRRIVGRCLSGKLS